MKKILFVNSCLSSGGSEKVMTLLANQFCKMDYDVTMVLLRVKPKSYYVEESVNLVEFCYSSNNKIIIALQRLAKLRQLLKNGKYDVVVSFMFDINMTTLLAGIGIRVPIIISERADPQNRGVGKLYEKIENILYNRAAGLVLQTDLVKNFYAQRVNTPLCVIPNPIVINEREYKGIRENRIVAVGRLCEQKNFPMLLSAFKEFVRKFPYYTLEIYGEGPLKESLLKLACDLEIGSKVDFKGYVNNVLEHIKTASMYISTSNYEGISNSMLEAMAMGIPTICTDCPVGGAAFIIENGVNGFLIPVNDKDSLVKKIEILASDIELREKLSAAAINVRTKFAVETIANEWEKLWKDREI